MKHEFRFCICIDRITRFAVWQVLLFLLCTSACCIQLAAGIATRMGFLGSSTFTQEPIKSGELLRSGGTKNVDYLNLLWRLIGFKNRIVYIFESDFRFILDYVS